MNEAAAKPEPDRASSLEPAQRRALAERCALLIDQAFASYNFHFRTVTQRARRRFERREWRGSQQDAVQRIELYDRAVRRTLERLEARLGPHLRDRALWAQIKADHSRLIRGYLDQAFNKTFFTSISRRVFDTVGVDPEIEYEALPLQADSGLARTSLLRRHTYRGSVWRLCAEILEHVNLGVPFRRKAQSVDRIVEGVDRCCSTLGGRYSLRSAEFITRIFYRDYRAYLVGRLVGADYTAPVAIALQHDDEGLKVDGVITSEDEVSIIFGFARSYFHVDVDPVRDAVFFLKSLLPRKPIGEIYTILGRAKQGKTERYRDLISHLQSSEDRFVDAAFDRGMVMIVFTLSAYPVVFKVIRDRFASSKNISRQDVLDRYRLVLKHDRAGRLVDAQEFRGVKFHRRRFEPDLLEQLLAEASRTVSVEGDDVVIRHLYMERRLTPLNRFLLEARESDARRAVIEYGQAIRDLAASNIFPGDLLLKNFGVTRHGRVIFYDYDELCLVTECNFREMPQARTLEEEMDSDTWYYVAENDVFPEQFVTFLGLEPGRREVFVRTHGELLTAAWWRGVQQRIRAGSVTEILPYRGR